MWLLNADQIITVIGLILGSVVLIVNIVNTVKSFTIKKQQNIVHDLINSRYDALVTVVADLHTQLDAANRVIAVAEITRQVIADERRKGRDYEDD